MRTAAPADTREESSLRGKGFVCHSSLETVSGSSHLLQLQKLIVRDFFAWQFISRCILSLSRPPALPSLPSSSLPQRESVSLREIPSSLPRAHTQTDTPSRHTSGRSKDAAEKRPEAARCMDLRPSLAVPAVFAALLLPSSPFLSLSLAHRFRRQNRYFPSEAFEGEKAHARSSRSPGRRLHQATSVPVCLSLPSSLCV